MIEAGIFDIGGVLHDYDSKETRQNVLGCISGDPIKLNATYTKLANSLGVGEINEQDFWELMIKESGVAQSIPQDSPWLLQFQRGFRPNTSVIEVIARLRARNYKLAALSNTIAPHVKYLTEQGIYQQFDVRTFSNEVGIMKPDPQIYLMTLDRLKKRPGEAFFVDDNEQYVQAATDLGIYGILFKDAHTLERDLKSLGVKI